MRLSRRHAVAVVALAAAILGLSGHAQAASRPPIRHVFIIVLENQSESTTFGPSPPAPYLAKTLTAQGAFVPNYYGTGHESNDNYIAMISGQAPNPQNQADCQIFSDFQPDVIGPNDQAVGTGCVYPADVKTVADQLDARGLTWRDYNQSMGADPTREPAVCAHPGLGQQDHTQSATATDQYATRHNPFVYFHAIIDHTARCDSHVVNLDLLPHDLSSAANTPNYVFITPDLCADGHDATCADPHRLGGFPGIDQFLKAWVPRITGSPAFRSGNGLLIINFDEGGNTSDSGSCCGEIAGPNSPSPGINGPGGGNTGAVLLSPCIRPGTVSRVAYNHYTMLRSVEDIFGLPHLGYAQLPGGQVFGSDVFTNPSCRTMPTAPITVHLHAPALASTVATGPRLRVHWSTTGVAAKSFTVQVRQMSTGGHGWRTLASAVKRRSIILRGRYGATYRIRVRAVAKSSAASDWATVTTVVPSSIPRGHYQGRWRATAVRDAWGGKAIIGSAGARFELKYVGGDTALIGSLWPQGGVARVTIDGTHEQIQVFSSQPHARQVIYSRILKPGRHRLTIRVLRGVVPIEGLAITDRRR